MEQKKTPEGEQIEILTTQEVRQGVTGHNVIIVLVVACALAVVLVGLVFLFVGR